MSLIYITGPTGAGKTTICLELREQGYEAHDVDDEGMRSLQGDAYTIKPEIMSKLATTAKSRLVFLCGTLPTDSELKHLFDHIILLKVDAETQEDRIRNRTNSSYGKHAAQLQTALSWRERQIDKYKQMSASVIDATLPITEIVNEVLRIVQQ